MKSLLIEKALTAEVRDVPIPEPGKGQVRLRVEYVGICGSDLHYYYEGANGAFVVREPLVPGHELSGRVDLDPSGALAPGTPVTVHPARFGTPREGIENAPHLWPGGSYLGSASTWPHTQGAASEYLIVEADMVRVLPDGLPVRRAVLAEPLAVALHALGKAGPVEGLDVLVTGSGPIGLMAVAAAVAAGARVTATDVLAGPLERAAALGASATVDVSADAVESGAYAVVLECSGVPVSISTALKAVRPGGTVVQVGMLPDDPRPVNLAPFISKEVRYLGAFRFRDEIDQAVALLAANPGIESALTHEFAVTDAAEAFATARDSQRSGKVVFAL
ncbi:MULTISPECIES: zinc-binding dehydrogenase [Microbacterium]|uniref:zinc-binding dehydrogenase n=1 Tax=Microbacterium TaxID=33882 RepID=UPI0023DB08EA|nr:MULTISPECIES: zinc-binding dehydrogenase [Microbacterium]MDF2046388.1 zinc-binding dehydrogenase [Microbacterium sp. Kw_RZR3]MDQ1076447.1 L-idonate 5-dehydrogenase [Microbacterium sp. SORGH_AS_0969]MDQ1116684.1 L-idonate 5-dehydrogenase [Microbacterium testaceum]